MTPLTGNPERPAAKCGFVALIGAPNAGKSTLINRLVGAKIAIVTHKVQTTRARLTGLTIVGDTQIVFVDTPGIFEPRRRLDRAMVSAAWRGTADADIVVLLVDAAETIGADVERIVKGLEASGRTAILALNKIDLIKRDKLLGLAERLDKSGVFSKIFMISALDGAGVDDLKAHLAATLPDGPWLYPADQLTDIAERLLAAEMTREQIFLRLHQELPYAITVETENWQEKKDGSVRIEQIIHVERKGHKGIVIGKGGKTLKKIGELARAEMEASFGHRVHLFLFVKISEQWSDKPHLYRDMGLDFVE